MAYIQEVIVQITADTKKWKKSVTDVQKETKDTVKKIGEDFEQSNKEIAGRFGKFTDSIIAAGKAALIAFAIAAAKSLVSSGLEWLRIEASLERSAKRYANATAEEVKMLSKLADEIQNNGIIAGDTLKKGQAELLRWGLTVNQTAEATGILADVLASLQEAGQSLDINALTSIIGRATKTGNLRGLYEYVRGLSDADAETFKNMKSNERFIFILQKLKEEYKGVNEEVGKSAYGNLQKLKNQWDDITKQLGAGLLPVLSLILQTLKPILNVITAVVEKFLALAKWVNESWFGKIINWILKYSNPLNWFGNSNDSNFKNPSILNSSPILPNNINNNKNLISVNIESRRDNWGGEYYTVLPDALGTQQNINYGREIY